MHSQRKDSTIFEQFKKITSKSTNDLEDYFERSVFFFKCSSWKLPRKELLFSDNTEKSYEEFQNSSIFKTAREAKRELNNTKDKLNDLDLKVWGEHTNFTSRSRNIVWQVRELKCTEMCTIAWCKMFEIYCEFARDHNRYIKNHGDYSVACSTHCDYTAFLRTQKRRWIKQRSETTLFPINKILNNYLDNSVEINSLHLCEAPGGFISATNHFVHTHLQSMIEKRKRNNVKINWNWSALSLNPFFEGNDLSQMIDDDKLMIETMGHWFFGIDDSGNIMSRPNIESLKPYILSNSLSSSSPNIESRKAKEPLHIITADGSVDCQEFPNEQEEWTSALHYCEMVAALSVLSIGGSFVIKTFTLFEHSTISMIYLMSCLFKEVAVYKPFSSKCGNSETYVICCSFLGIDDDYLFELIKHAHQNTFEFPSETGTSKNRKWKRCMLNVNDYPRCFLEQMNDCAFKFANWQKQIIEENLFLFKNYERYMYRKAFQWQKNEAARIWMRRYQVREMSGGDLAFLTKSKVTGSRFDTGKSLTLDSHRDPKLGSLSDRKRKLSQISNDCDNNNDDNNNNIIDDNANEVSQSDQPHLKKQKIDNDIELRAISELDASENNDTASEKKLSFSEMYMKKYGFVDGLGLGSTLHGMNSPLELNTQLNTKGLGYESHLHDSFLSDFSTSLLSHSYFLNSPSPQGKCDPNLVLKSLKAVIVPKISIINQSQFINSLPLYQNLISKRKSFKSSTSPSICQSLFPCCHHALQSTEDNNYQSDLITKLKSVTGIKLPNYSSLSLIDSSSDKQISSDEINHISNLIFHNPDLSADYLCAHSIFFSCVNSCTKLNDREKVINELLNHPKVKLVIGNINEDPLMKDERNLDFRKSVLVEFITAISILDVDGDFVFKMHDFFSRFTINLLFLISLCFEEFIIEKPPASCPLRAEYIFIFKRFCITSTLSFSSCMFELLERLVDLSSNDHNTKAKIVCENLPMSEIQLIGEPIQTRISHLIDTILESELDIVEFIKPSMMRTDFIQFIKSSNSLFATRAINAFEHLENYLKQS